jgi:transcriptional regulator GlxA family with amidase domain
MQIAFLLFDELTALDAVGPYDVLNRIPGAETVFVAERPGQFETEAGTLSLVASHSLSDVPSPEILVIPGGDGTRALMTREPVLEWVRSVHPTSTWTTSVCTGSLVLAAAGLLDGIPAATHWMAREELGELGAIPTAERIVEHGKIVTAAGVSAGIDMALTLVQRMYGDELSQAIQLGIEYDPQPPFDAGSPEKADPNVVAAVRAFRSAEQVA